MTRFDRYCEVLGIGSRATPEEIKRAYRDMALVWHPDRFVNAPHLRQKAEQKMREINEAYAFLQTRPQSETQGTDTPEAPDLHAKPTGRGPAEASVPTSGIANVAPEHTWQGPGRPTGVALSPDGRTAWMGGDGLRAWDTTTGTLRREYNVDRGELSGLCASPDGRFLLYGYSITVFGAAERRDVRVCDTASGDERLRLKGLRGRLTAAAYSTRGDIIAAGDAQGGIALWESATGRQIRQLATIDRPGAVRRVAFCDGDRRLVSLRINDIQEQIVLWNMENGTLIKELTTHVRDSRRYGQIQDVAPTPDGRTLVVANNDPLRHAWSLHQWDIETDRELRTMEGHQDRVTQVTMAANGRWALSSSEDKTVRLWDIASARELCRFAGAHRAIAHVALSADCRVALASASNGTVVLWLVPVLPQRRVSGA